MKTDKNLQRRSLLRVSYSVTVLLACFGRSILGDTVTLPVAASVVGEAPFLSDVRVFNTSYTNSLDVTATYRCTPGSSTACATQPVKTFTLAPREARAFDNICVSLFEVPNSLGAVEFATASGGDGIVVTSRLYSPAAVPPWPAGTIGSVGMFIPALPASAAQPVTVLSNLSNRGSTTGSFRTNIGVYNPNSKTVAVTVKLFADLGSFPPSLLGAVPLMLTGQTGTQISDIYRTVGFETLTTTTGYATVESNNAVDPLFTYAAVVDDTTQDPVLIVGAPDLAEPAGFQPAAPPQPGNSSTPTPTPVVPTPTPTPTSATAVAVSLQATRFQWAFNGSGSSFVMHVGQTYRVQISDGDPNGPAHGFGGTFGPGPQLIARQSPLSIGGSVTVMVTAQPSQIGTHSFACDQSSCGSGHGNMLGAITVQP